MSKARKRQQKLKSRYKEILPFAAVSWPFRSDIAVSASFTDTKLINVIVSLVEVVSEV
jgi:hypothetical protein